MTYIVLGTDKCYEMCATWYAYGLCWKHSYLLRFARILNYT